MFTEINCNYTYILLLLPYNFYLLLFYHLTLAIYSFIASTEIVIDSHFSLLLLFVLTTVNECVLSVCFHYTNLLI